MIKANLNTLFQYSMKPLMKAECKENGRFFTEKEYEKNKGKIMIIAGAMHGIEKQFNTLNNG